ncbi:MAG: CCA tRNA nucleotidyltransferase [Gloeocapsa sp. UFS-A4-WI-NPMV-4B04]|jgi:tRNA nucleotidyltransferase (CCA-adding enzyme)|nr:CCA tRNA nucleotidyltransferase [Gloeocapsa sp. UFS-A4-WI-NPMV-4B04]
MSSCSVSSLADINWPFSLEFLPQPAYLVGGAVRDAMLERQSEYLDLDFVLLDAVKTARVIASSYQAGFVLLDHQRQIARVVFPHATVDFAEQEGNCLETDLNRRDFTINAIAYNPHNGEIIDPLQGCADLKQGLLRMVKAANLQDDPLRLLRAYRQAAQLSFAIEPETQATIRQLAPELSKVASERVRVELNYLLGSSKGNRWISAAWEDGLLEIWFDNVKRSPLSQLTAIDTAAVALSQNFPLLGVELSQAVRNTIKTSWLTIAKLATLVNPDPETAEIQLTQLTYSRAEIQGVTIALKLLPQLISNTVPLLQISPQEQYFLFRTAGRVFPVVAVLAVANGVAVEAILPLINRYLNPDDPVAHPTALVTGKELMQALEIPSSPTVGKLLNDITLAKIEGKISTPAEALNLASQLLDTL